MGMRIKSNLDSLRARRHLGDNRQMLSDSIERLSSGNRINKSADDAAGLAVSEKIRARIASLNVAKRNASDSVSYLQVAEGGLNEITNLVIRMRELGAQSASDTVGNDARSLLNKEFQQLSAEVKRIVDSTEFNSAKVLKPDENSTLRLFIGASNRGDKFNGDSPNIDPDNDPDVIEVDFSDLQALTEGLAPISEGILAVIPDDPDGGAQDLGPDGTDDLFNKLDTALNSISSYRATLGSIQSRLNSAMTTIEVSSENLSAANSRIKDTDYAEETARYAHARIMQQAGAAILGQANINAEIALSLIR